MSNVFVDDVSLMSALGGFPQEYFDGICNALSGFFAEVDALPLPGWWWRKRAQMRRTITGDGSVRIHVLGTGALANAVVPVVIFRTHTVKIIWNELDSLGKIKGDAGTIKWLELHAFEIFLEGVVQAKGQHLPTIAEASTDAHFLPPVISGASIDDSRQV